MIENANIIKAFQCTCFWELCARAQISVCPRPRRDIALTETVVGLAGIVCYWHGTGPTWAQHDLSQSVYVRNTWAQLSRTELFRASFEFAAKNQPIQG